MPIFRLIEWLFHMVMRSQSHDNKPCVVSTQGVLMHGRLIHLSSDCPSDHFGNDTWGQLCTLLKNRNIEFICLKMSVVAVWIPVCVSVKYLSIWINIDEMPAV